jgi:hypothetical protein
VQQDPSAAVIGERFAIVQYERKRGLVQTVEREAVRGSATGDRHRRQRNN